MYPELCTLEQPEARYRLTDKEALILRNTLLKVPIKIIQPLYQERHH